MTVPSRNTFVFGSIGIILPLVVLYDLFFRFEMNEFIFFLILYPSVAFVVGVISYFIFKNAWMGFATILAAGLLSMFLYVIAGIGLNVFIYSLIGLFGALVGKGLAQLRHA